MRGLSVNRGRPDLEALSRETDPERFLWRALPHAARSFAASIVVLPREQARAAAVGYLYCRMLDTYEDLIAEPEASVAELRRFADRFDTDTPAAPNPIADELARDDRDRVYLLLIDRCELVDEVFMTLPDEVRRQIRELVRSMAAGMEWSTHVFADQGGVLMDQDQLALYCHNVIGYPALFTLELIASREVTAPARADALLVSEMIQLANVTRDIERDLARRVAYHPALKPYLGSSGYEGASRAAVKEVREELTVRALERAPAYRRLFDRLDLGGTAKVRAAAILMILFTDLHYRSCARRTGNAPWPGPRGRLQVVASALPALVSPRWANRTLRRTEAEFAEGASRLASNLSRPGVLPPAAPA